MKQWKTEGFFSILALKDKKKINLFILICSSEVSPLFLLSLIEIFLGFGEPLGPILPWDSRGDATPSIPAIQVTLQECFPNNV